MAEPDELDPEVRALLHAERTAPLRGVSEAKARGLARLLESVAALEAGGATPQGLGPTPDAKLDRKLDAKRDGTRDAKPDEKLDAKPDPKPDEKLDAKPDEKLDAKPDPKPDPKPDEKLDAKPDEKLDAKPDLKPAVPVKTLVFVATTSGVVGMIVGAAVMWAVWKSSPKPSPSFEEPSVEAPVERANTIDEGDAQAPAEAPSVEPPRVEPPRVEPPRVEPTPSVEASPAPTGPSVMQPEPETTTEPSADPARPVSRLARERALIDQARAALRAGRAHDALVALMGHEREFPSGTLAEDRERLAVEALVSTGRHAAARRRADAFVARYPTSAHRARIEELVREP